MPLLTSFKVKKSLKAIPRFVPMPLEEAFSSVLTSSIHVRASPRLPCSWESPLEEDDFTVIERLAIKFLRYRGT